MNAKAMQNSPVKVDHTANYRGWRDAAAIAAIFTPPAAYGNSGAILQAAIAVVRVPMTARFRRLADQWIAETENMSAVEDMIVHPAYQEITGMGPAIIPLLLDELEREPNHWFAALYAVSGGQNPVPPEDAGDVDKMVEAWFEWAETNGYR
jgi:hypothetical protein